MRTLALVVVLSLPALAQKLDPVHWTLTAEPAKAPPGSPVLLRLNATLDEGWHLYSLTTPKPPIATTIKLADSPAIGKPKIYNSKPIRKLDPNFNTETETYEKAATFMIAAELAKDASPGELQPEIQVRYQACNDRLCLNPVRKTLTVALTVDPSAPVAEFKIPDGFTGVGSTPPPVKSTAQSQGLGAFLLVAFGLGLAAIFTPCVFPMIPITMSFFVGQKGGIFQAATFSIGIIVLFSALGLITTAALGPFGVVQLGSSPWVNSFIALVLLAFALSLLGVFEITLPSGLLTRLDRASQKGGVFGTLLMGLTFSLTSFACVGPLMGTLLVASVQGGGIQPFLGMVTFATGLASPFFLLALFPSYLQKLPKSGAWLPRVKIVMSFVVLALMLKYWSNVDQVLQWSFLTRERFLAGWIVLFALPGLYLLGFLRLEGILPDEPVGIPRLLIGSLFLIFALSLLPGVFGARLGEIEAFLPPATGTTLGASAETRLPWMKNQYREALAKARQEGKLVFVNFTGYACTNCHWMQANMFPRPEIAAALKEFVLLELYTDGTDEASRQNQELEEKKFSSSAIPLYAILDPDEKVIATFSGATRDANEFLAFLKSRT